MRIVVFGSTGGTGLALLEQACKRGHQVIAFARDRQKIPDIDPAPETIEGDALNPEAVTLAVNGADAVISALGARLGQPPGVARSEGTQNIVNALAAAGVKRFISVSTIGVNDTLKRLSPIGRWLVPRIIGAERLREAERQEEIVRQTDLAWTILRPPRLVDGPVTGHYRIGLDLKTGLSSKIARADLATALLDQLESDEFIGTCPSVLG